MHKIPYIIKWSVNPAMNPEPGKTLLDPAFLTLHIGTQVAEDASFRASETIHFKLGGEAPAEGTNLAHVQGDLVKAVEEVQRLLSEAAFTACNIVKYADLPAEVKETLEDPSLKERTPGIPGSQPPVVVPEVPKLESIPQKLLSMIQRPFIG